MKVNEILMMLKMDGISLQREVVIVNSSITSKVAVSLCPENQAMIWCPAL